MYNKDEKAIEAEAHYDYIVVGGGASGLSLLDRFDDEKWADKKILLLEPNLKKGNDRTWSSWVKSNERYTDLSSKTWSFLDFIDQDGNKIDLTPKNYVYRMLESSNFYKYIHNKISKNKNISVLEASYISYEINNGKIIVHTSKGNFSANHVFKSIFSPVQKEDAFVYVDQHFKGWFIKTEEDSFDEEKCTIMDFSIPQNGDIRFMYVLPKHKNIALVEIAIFSNNLLTHEQYDSELKDYIENKLKIKNYEILDTEFGIIPMTSFNFEAADNHYITHIGTAAGNVKTSSGYAFTRIQKHVDAIIKCINAGKHPGQAKKVLQTRYKFLDNVMLNVLLNHNVQGAVFFRDLFLRNSADSVFKFLNEDNNLIEDMKLMNLPNKWPFIKSFFKTLIKA